jgi:hypothetical protein
MIYYVKGKTPPKGTRSFILKYQGYGGISLDSLLIFPGFLIIPFLKPMKEPSHTFGIESRQYTIRRTKIVGKDMAAEDFSNQFAKLMIIKIKKTKPGKANDTHIVHNNHSPP